MLVGLGEYKMNFKNKNILVFGLGLSGISSLKALDDKNCKLFILDSRNKKQLAKELEEIREINAKSFLGAAEAPLENIDLIVKSPGIPPHNDFIKKAIEQEIPIISDLELSYLLSKTKSIIGITGTNGKTSTTSLLGELLSSKLNNVYLTGNIGIPTPELMNNSTANDKFVIECSSFQLDGTDSFKPKIGILINLREDHIDWHGSFNNYVDSKMKLFANQDRSDYAILNYDDELIKEKSNEINSNIIWFSKNKLDRGVYIDKDDIIINMGSEYINLGSCLNLNIILENALAAIAAAYIMGIDSSSIYNILHSFKSLEHRMEFVKTINEVDYYNDSKGTNPDSTIMALKHLDNNIVLIAGGYDKGSHYDDLAIEIKNRVNSLILMGDTKLNIKNSVEKAGFFNIHLVKDMAEAVNLASEISSVGEKVLLSPACASWGLYKNFEERGRDFKNKVKSL